MKELKQQLDLLLQQSGYNNNFIDKHPIEGNYVFPFSKEGRILAFLLASHTITYEKYLELSQQYYQRNQYLNLFEMSPRSFGETWGETHILSLFPVFTKATKNNVCQLYPDFDGEFDLLLDQIRVEVKACRANSTKTTGSLASRAYLHEEAKTASFKYHYQQLKPSCCDVFIWIGVCRDELLYWVLTSNELLNTGKFGPQHRNENTGAAEAKTFEGQVFMTEEELHKFRVNERDILNIVRKKGEYTHPSIS